MINAIKIPRVVLLLAAVTLAAAVFCPNASAQDVLLIIDDYDPAAVTFTPTGNHPEVTDTTHIYNDGIALTGFFSSTPVSYYYPVLSTPTLTTVDSGSPVYNFVQPNDLFPPGNNEDLNICRDGSTQDAYYSEEFYAGSSAFQGMETVDFSGDASALPAPGTTGNIYAGCEGDPYYTPPVLLGTFAVVPEAGTGTYVVLGALGLLLARRYRRDCIGLRA